MLANFGFGVQVLAFVVAIYGIGAAIYGARKNSLAWVESARLSMLLSFPLLTVVVGTMVALQVNGNFDVTYIYQNTSRSLPLYLKITALWGGQAGSLVFWSWLMAGFASAVCLRKWQRDREFLPWVIVVSLVTLAFFLALGTFVENPFRRWWAMPGGETIAALFPPAGAMPFMPPDGQGLNPLLRHPGMIIHPPMLYLGFVSFVIPFAFAIAALVTGRADDRWIRVTRRWTLVGWLFLSLGLVLGSRWAYDVLGWGGYWAWDPVEIAALMPWLSGTAFLHSVMIQEKRALFKRWNLILIITTYALVIFGTFLTRSGVLSSVHAFASSAIGPLFFGFICITFLGSLGLLLYRWNSLKAEGQMTSLMSRESFFLFNNLVFMGVLAVCFWGVLFPIISELFTGLKVTVGPPFYKRTTGPLFGGLLLLMGVAPLTAWSASTARTLGKALWKPVLVSLGAPLLGFVLGVRDWIALVALWLVGVAVFVTLYDYGRSVLSHAKQSNIFAAFWKLTGRNRRRYGGYMIHLAVVMMSLGIIGIEFFQTETQGTVAKGGSITLDSYQVTYKALDEIKAPDGHTSTVATLSVVKDGVYVGDIQPQRDWYPDAEQTMTIPGLRSTLADDLYVILVDWQQIGSAGATFKIYHNPLVIWLWIGSVAFILGTLVAAWPEKDTA